MCRTIANLHQTNTLNLLLFQAPHPRTPHHSLTISSNTFNMDLIDTIRNVSKRYARRPIKWPWKKLNTTTPSSSTTPSTTTMGPTSPETISSVIDGFYNVSDCLDGNCSWASLDNMTDVWADSTLCEGSGTTTDFIVMMITAFVLGVIILSTVIGEFFFYFYYVFPTSGIDILIFELTSSMRLGFGHD